MDNYNRKSPVYIKIPGFFIFAQHGIIYPKTKQREGTHLEERRDFGVEPFRIVKIECTVKRFGKRKFNGEEKFISEYPDTGLIPLMTEIHKEYCAELMRPIHDKVTLVTPCKKEARWTHLWLQENLERGGCKEGDEVTVHGVVMPYRRVDGSTDLGIHEATWIKIEE